MGGFGGLRLFFIACCSVGFLSESVLSGSRDWLFSCEKMEVQILQLLEGARQATGLTVVIDVFRAFSTACYAFEKGADRILPVGEVEEAFRLAQTMPGALLMGERDERKPDGFDFGNSPALLPAAGLTGKTIIHTTSSGTQGIVNAVNADEIITGSFVNAGAVVRHIRQQQPRRVSLVCMGYACQYPTDEDTLCAEYIRNELAGQPSDFAAMTQQIREGSGARFFAPESQEWAPVADFDLCLALSRFNFVLKARQEGGFYALQKVVV